MCKMTRQSPNISTSIAMSYFIGLANMSREGVFKGKETMEDKRKKRMMKGKQGKEKTDYSSSRLILAKTQEFPDAISLILELNASCHLIGIGP